MMAWTAAACPASAGTFMTRQVINALDRNPFNNGRDPVVVVESRRERLASVCCERLWVVDAAERGRWVNSLTGRRTTPDSLLHWPDPGTTSVIRFNITDLQ